MKEDIGSAEPQPANGEISAVSEGESNTKEGSASYERDEFRSRFLRNLMLRKQEVEEALSRLIDGQKEQKTLFSTDDFIEELDRAEREISVQTAYSLLEKKNEELEKIEALISRALGDEDFGLCEECGERIPEERLLVVPEAVRCVSCQRDLEELGSRRAVAGRSFVSLAANKALPWQDIQEDSDDKGELSADPDLDNLSFLDLEEIDPQEDTEQNNGAEFPLAPPSRPADSSTS